MNQKSNEVKQSKRNYGIDLLKALSMYMVVILHVLGQGGVLGTCQAYSFHYYAAWLLEISAFCAVNCFALTSGYLMEGRRFRYTRVLELWLQVVCYTLAITAVFFLLFPDEIYGGGYFWNALFPVSHQQYWYFTAYFCMALFIPFLNRMLEHISKKEAVILLAVMFLLFSVLPIISRRDVFGMGGGYSAWWLMALYLCGGIIHKFDLFSRWTAGGAFAGYCAAVILTELSKYVLECWLHQDGNLLLNYVSPTIAACAVMLLIFFSKIQVSDWLCRILKRISPLVFSVYLIHVHPLVFEKIIGLRFVRLAELPIIFMLLAVLGMAACIFLICIGVDAVRNQIFRVLKVSQRTEQLWEGGKRKLENIFYKTE